MADMIDPDRINIKIPNIQQRILPIGTSSEITKNILMVADRLFDATYLPNFKCKKLKTLALEAAKEIHSMNNMYSKLRDDQLRLIEEIEGQKLSNGFVLPYLEDADIYLKSFFQRADHFIRNIFYIMREFEPGFENLDRLRKRLTNEKEKGEQFHEFITNASPYVNFIRNTRNSIEHPSDQMRVTVSNFELDASAQIVNPTFELRHPRTPQPRTDLVNLLRNIVDSFLRLFADWMANLCARHASLGNFSVGVFKTSDEVKFDEPPYSYAVLMGDQWQPIG